MPVRLLKPTLRTSERWHRSTYFDRCLYISLLNLVDDFGRYDASPQLLASECFPYGDEEGFPMTPGQIDGGLRALASKDLLFVYESGSKQYLQITRWHERVRQKASKFPESANCKVIWGIDGQLPVNCASTARQLLASPPSPSPSPTPAPAPAPTRRESFPEVEVPDWPAIQLVCAQIGLPEWRARDWFNEMEAAGWKDRHRREVMNWRAMLNQVKSFWERDGRHVDPPNRSATNGRPDRPMDIKTIIQAKESLAAQLRTKYCSDTAIDAQWSNTEKKKQFFKLKKEIKGLNEKLSNMA